MTDTISEQPDEGGEHRFAMRIDYKDSPEMCVCGARWPCTRAYAAEKQRADKAEASLADLQSTFDLRWKADMRAIKMWQAKHPDKKSVWPDHADLVVWLMEQVDTLKG